MASVTQSANFLSTRERFPKLDYRPLQPREAARAGVEPRRPLSGSVGVARAPVANVSPTLVGTFKGAAVVPPPRLEREAFISSVTNAVEAMLNRLFGDLELHGRVMVDGPRAGIPADVARFCRQRNISADVNAVAGLLYSCFTSIVKLEYRLSVDPEDGSEQVLIQFWVGCGVDEALDSYDAFVSKWVAASTRDTRDLIRISYDIARHDTPQVSDPGSVAQRPQAV